MNWFKHVLVSAFVMSFPLSATANDMFFPDAEFDDTDIVPEVLTATRLKQPRAEVPGSMTVIDAKQIERWGVRTIPELMRFVPGMFVKHGSDDAVAYHASSPSLMRRMQVLIDGRSVYRAGLASVGWDDIPVALEDIQRIEVFRGPNAATYGANAFMATINIVTFHPADTLGSRAYVRKGHQGTRDYFASHSGQAGETLYRLTAVSKEDDGFDGSEDDGPGDTYHDATRDRFVSLNLTNTLSDRTMLLTEAAYKSGRKQLPQASAEPEAPNEENDSGFLYSRLNHEFSVNHSMQLQAYWQTESRRATRKNCGPSVTLSSELYALYDQDPYWADVVGRTIPGALMSQDSSPESYAQAQALVQGIALGAVTPGQVEAAIEDATERDFDISQADLDQAQQIFINAFNGSDFSNLAEVVCGEYDVDMKEQRVDVEWQDTMQWSDSLRSVAGLSYRRDQVESETYFNGVVSSDLFRIFANTEWHITERLIANVGGMYENEDTNDAVFSPRVALNLLVKPQQSLRLVYSTSVRSPDLLEKSPDYSIEVAELTDNYLGLDKALYYAHQQGRFGQLEHEKITSVELGYYARLPARDIAFDVKLYKDHLYQLISNPLNLQTPVTNSDTTLDIKGLDWQITWTPSREHSFWWSGAYVDTEVRLGDTSFLTPDEIGRLQDVETRLSAEYSNNLSWTFDPGSWQITQSYFWHNAYNRDRTNPKHYRRYELHWHKAWPVKGVSINTDVFWHHLIDDNYITYSNEVYSQTDLGYLQVGINF